MSEGSPLQKYCEEIDLKYYEKPYGWYYYELALKQVPTEFITNVLLKDYEWRANHQQNVLDSTEGSQSSGKSIFQINKAIWLGNIFGNPFVLERDIFSNPYDLDISVRNPNEVRRTFLYDEQPQRMVGMGSASTKISLKDYEEIGRYSQKNILYASPELREHSHYFVFKQVDYDINRITNPVCKKCEKFSQCVKNFYSTLCDITFDQRDGYPIDFRFMLFTKRLSDQVMMPRGIVTFPMLAPRTAKAYDDIKKRNIKNFEIYENNSWNQKMQLMRDFVVDNFDTLIKDTKDGKRVIPINLIRVAFFNHFSTNRFLNDEVEMFISAIKQMVEEKLKQ